MKTHKEKMEIIDAVHESRRLQSLTWAAGLLLIEGPREQLGEMELMDRVYCILEVATERAERLYDLLERRENREFEQ